jgi:hypothetical protein
MAAPNQDGSKSLNSWASKEGKQEGLAEADAEVLLARLDLEMPDDLDDLAAGERALLMAAEHGHVEVDLIKQTMSIKQKKICFKHPPISNVQCASLFCDDLCARSFRSFHSVHVGLYVYCVLCCALVWFILFVMISHLSKCRCSVVCQHLCFVGRAVPAVPEVRSGPTGRPGHHAPDVSRAGWTRAGEQKQKRPAE